MLSDIITQAVTAEPDMVVVGSLSGAPKDLGSVSIRRRIDVIIFGQSDAQFQDGAIDKLLHANPRLGLLAIDGTADDGVLHHLVPAHRRIGRLAQSSVAAAVRDGAMLRRGG
jgi:hypothetical protein